MSDQSDDKSVEEGEMREESKLDTPVVFADGDSGDDQDSEHSVLLRTVDRSSSRQPTDSHETSELFSNPVGPILGGRNTFFSNTRSGIGNEDADIVFGSGSPPGPDESSELSTIVEVSEGGRHDFRGRLPGPNPRFELSEGGGDAQRSASSNANAVVANRKLTSFGTDAGGREGHDPQALQRGFPPSRVAGRTEVIDLGGDDYESDSDEEDESDGEDEARKQRESRSRWLMEKGLREGRAVEKFQEMQLELEERYDQLQMHRYRSVSEDWANGRQQIVESLARGAVMNLIAVNGDPLSRMELDDFEMVVAAGKYSNGLCALREKVSNMLLCGPTAGEIDPANMVEVVDHFVEMMKELRKEATEMLGSREGYIAVMGEMTSVRERFETLSQGKKLKKGDIFLPAGEDRRQLVQWIFQVSWAMGELLRSKALVSQNVEGMRELFRSHPRIQLRAEEKMAIYTAKGCRPPQVLEEMERREQKRMGKKINEEISDIKGVGPTKVSKLPIFAVSSGSEEEGDDEADEDDQSSQEAGDYDILGHLTLVVEKELQKRGKNSVAIKKAILDDKAPLFLWRSVTKLGTEASVAGKFKGYALSWDADQPFNWRKFFRKVDTSCDLVNMSSLMRIKFLVSTAGLRSTSVKDVRQQLVNHLKHIQTRVEYDFNSHPETDLVYWAEMWTRVKMDVILKFWRDPNETAIEEEIDGMLADLRYDDGSTLNNSAGKLLMWYENLVEFQDDVGSVMITTPFWLFDKFRKTLKKKGKVGVQQERIIEEMMTLIVENPAKHLPRNHGLSDKTVENLEGKSTSSLPEEVYRILLQEIGDRGHDNKLQVIIRGEEDWMTVPKRQKTGGEDKTSKMTLNAMTISPAIGGGGSGSSKGQSKTNFELLCDSCGLFCKDQPGDSCRVIKNGKVFVEELLKFKYSIFEPKDGSRWSVNKSLLEKLTKFFYPKMGWGEAEQKEMYAELVKGVNALYDKDRKGVMKGGKSVIVNNVTNSHNNTNTNRVINSPKAMIVTSDPKKDRQEKEIARQALQIKQLKKEAKARQKSMTGDDDADEEDEEEETVSDDEN
jgi:hypothetical protein